MNNNATFLSIEVSDVDKSYEKAKSLGYEIVSDLTDEPWGVRCFFVNEPKRATIFFFYLIDDVKYASYF